MCMMKDASPPCAIVLVADGFEETETITILGLLRQAGLCVKSVGLTSGLVSSAHGVWVMPDRTLADLDSLLHTTPISAVILPEGTQSVAKLEADPRVHNLLRQVAAQRGQFVTSQDGLRVIRAAIACGNELDDVANDSALRIILREPEQPLGAFVLDLVRRLKQSPQVHKTTWKPIGHEEGR
jgi:hypothetical protein